MADPLPPLMANLACFLFAFLYVAGIYVLQGDSQQARKLSRDHPLVIKNRIKSVILTSCIVPALVWLLLSPSQSKFAQALGMTIPDSASHALCILSPLLLTGVLFLGPLCQLYFDQTLVFQKYANVTEDIKHIFTTLVGQRNYVVASASLLAPATEEFVFRSCMIPVLHQAGYSTTYIILVTPLYFGLAHLHHLQENYYRLGGDRTALMRAAMTSLCQFIYTTLFGWYVTFVFMRHGNIWSPILCHSFCNLMGLPDLSDMALRTKTEQKVIYGAYVLGLLLFIRLLYTLTNPALVGGSLYWPPS
ncbi:CAAX protease self-immunity-domain-containing protein [Dichotomocladium elegans]|nr:CAAX protease self-immunity-domain-containing protein [Dichotomocladium elegans]